MKIIEEDGPYNSCGGSTWLYLIAFNFNYTLAFNSWFVYSF